MNTKKRIGKMMNEIRRSKRFRVRKKKIIAIQELLVCRFISSMKWLQKERMYGRNIADGARFEETRGLIPAIMEYNTTLIL